MISHDFHEVVRIRKGSGNGDRASGSTVLLVPQHVPQECEEWTFGATCGGSLPNRRTNLRNVVVKFVDQEAKCEAYLGGP